MFSDDFSGNEKHSYSKEATNLKSIKVVFYHINMGASEEAIVQKTEKQMVKVIKEIDPSIQIKFESHHYYGDYLYHEEITKNPMKALKKYRPNMIAQRTQEINTIIKNLKEKNNQVLDEDSFIKALDGYSVYHLQQVNYSNLEGLPGDVKILNSYGKEIKKLADAKPVETQNTQEFEIRILLAQTASCSLYSLTSHGASRITEKQSKEEDNFFNDFKKALSLFSPNVVICENIKNIPEDIKKEIQTELSKKSLTVYNTVRCHDNYTATYRERHYSIGHQTNLKPNDFNFPTKKRIPEQFLYHLNGNKKYLDLKNSETVLSGLRKKTATLNSVTFKKNKKQDEFDKIRGTTIQVNGKTDFINKIRLYVSYQKKVKELGDTFLVILPCKAYDVFRRKSGKETKRKDITNGLSVRLTTKHAVRFYLANGNNFESLLLVHSHVSTPTLVKRPNYLFWDKDGYSTSVGEESLIQGMSKSYTQRLIENDIKPTEGFAMLSHNLSSKVVSPILSKIIIAYLVEKKLLPSQAEFLPTEKKSNENIEELINSDFEKGFNLDDYKLVKIDLECKTEMKEKPYVYYLADKEGRIVDDGIVFSSLPLRQLQAYFSNSNLSISENDRDKLNKLKQKCNVVSTEQSKMILNDEEEILCEGTVGGDKIEITPLANPNKRTIEQPVNQKSCEQEEYSSKRFKSMN